MGKARANRKRCTPDIFDHARQVLIVKNDIHLRRGIVAFRHPFVYGRRSGMYSPAPMKAPLLCSDQRCVPSQLELTVSPHGRGETGCHSRFQCDRSSVPRRCERTTSAETCGEHTLQSLPAHDLGGNVGSEWCWPTASDTRYSQTKDGRRADSLLRPPSIADPF